MNFRQITKIFDPADGYAPFTNPQVVTDSTVVKRGNRWWLYLGGKLADRPAIQLFSASLPEGAPLSAKGWCLTPDPNDPTKVAMLASQEASAPWDLKGGRHCPSYVKGWDPKRGAWVERIYYAGGADFVWGPYTIGYLEWDGERWVDQRDPAFIANEPWERGSVYEPNLIYHDGLWRMWYVAGSNGEDYLVHGYAESADGQTNWSPHKMFCPPEEKMFDFCVRETPRGFEAVYSRVWVANTPRPATTGLWWCHAETPSSDRTQWCEPVQILTAQDYGAQAGPWKPSMAYGESDPDRIFVFFDGVNTKLHPYAFTLHCLEMDRPK